MQDSTCKAFLVDDKYWTLTVLLIQPKKSNFVFMFYSYYNLISLNIFIIQKSQMINLTNEMFTIPLFSYCLYRNKDINLNCYNGYNRNETV